MPKIICVQSFRHGTGQSNLIASLAVTLARRGQRIGIIDPNSKVPGIHTLFHLDADKVDHCINAYLWGNPTEQHPSPFWSVGDGEIIVLGGEVYLAPDSVKFNEIAQQLGQGCDVGQLNQELFELGRRLQLDYLFFDSQPGLSNENFLYMTLSDILLLSLCLDIQSFQGIAITVDVARRLEIPQILLLANQVLAEFEEDDVQNQLADAYGEPVIGVLRFSSEMQELASQDIFYLRYPQHPLSQAIEGIALRLTDLSWATVTPTPGETLEGPPLNHFDSHTNDDHPSLFHVLSLPYSERQIVNFILRHKKATLAEIANHLNQDEVNIQPLLNTLINQGFLLSIEVNHEVCYVPYLIGKRPRPRAESWSPLDTLTGENE